MKDIKSILAKSNGTTLYDHTMEVINLVDMLCYGIEDKDFIYRCRTAAVLHDIGKCADSFQNMVKNNKDYQDGVKHNIMSWAFSRGSLLHNRFLSQITDAVLYHHSVPVNNEYPTKVCDILESIKPEELKIMTDFYKLFGDKVIPLENDIDYTDDMDCLSVPLYRSSESISPDKLDMESQSLMLRAILVKADRIASDDDKKYNHNKIRTNDTAYIHSIIHNVALNTTNELRFDACLESHYDMDRLKTQQDIVSKSVLMYSKKEKNTMMVNASAGFGKTLLGLMSIVRRGRKTVWCVPTREIAMSTFMSIKAELEKMDYSLSVCLFFANEIQDKYKDDSESIQDYDITVSVIDSMLSSLHDNNMGHLMYSYLVGDMIFDEYHNVVGDNALFASMSLLLRTRMQFMNSYSLLLSATPLSPYHMGITCTNKIYEFKPKKYKGDIKINFHYVEKVSDITYFLPNSFIITNTVAQAQNMYLMLKKKGYNNLMLYHAQYEKNDITEIRKRLFDNFGKNTPESDMIVVCTGIIGTGLDISAKNIYDYTLTPSDTLQRVCGRASRFGEYESINYFLCDINEKDADNIGKGNSLFVGITYDKKLRDNFINGMKGNDGKTFTKDELYDKVNKFNDMFSKDIQAFYMEKMKNSRKNLSSITLKRTKSSNGSNTRYTSKQTTLRGTGKDVFVAIQHGNKYALFTMDSERAKRIETGYDDTNIRKFRMTFYEENNMYQKNWKYKYGIKDSSTCNFDTCVELAYCSETPLPVKNMTYDSELGARAIK